MGRSTLKTVTCIGMCSHMFVDMCTDICADTFRILHSDMCSTDGKLTPRQSDNH